MTNEFETSPGTPREPFAPEPAQVPGGCGRPLLVGCAAAVVVAGALLLVLLLKAGDWLPQVFRWSLEQLQQQVEAGLPPEIGEAERRRLAAAFEAAADAVADGTADPAALQRLQGLLIAAARARGALDREELEALVEALEAVAAERAPPPAPAARGPQPVTAG